MAHDEIQREGDDVEVTELYPEDGHDARLTCSEISVIVMGLTVFAQAVEGSGGDPSYLYDVLLKIDTISRMGHNTLEGVVLPGNGEVQ